LVQVKTHLNEIEILAQKCAMHGQTSFITQYLVPMHNILRSLKGLSTPSLAPLDVLVNNDELLEALLKEGCEIDIINLLMLEITFAFISRNMERAKQISNLADEKITVKPLVFNQAIIDFYAGLTVCYSARQSEDASDVSKAQEVCDKLEWILNYSQWNFQNKFHLLQAECHFSRGEIGKAATSYQAAIASAKDHKFVNEEALACELSGYFYKEQGDEAKAKIMFKQAQDAYIKWGALAKGLDLNMYLQ
jgi:tetratricopeptide (TPR) repeat protein